MRRVITKIRRIVALRLLEGRAGRIYLYIIYVGDRRHRPRRGYAHRILRPASCTITRKATTCFFTDTSRGRKGGEMVTLIVSTTADAASIGPASALLAMPGWLPGPSLQVFALSFHLHDFLSKPLLPLSNFISFLFSFPENFKFLIWILFPNMIHRQ